jgi:transcriptional regulator with XRE-family HTH domain
VYTASSRPATDRPNPQPVKEILAARGIQSRDVAKRMSRTPAHVSRVLNGWMDGSLEFRTGLAEMLGLPVEVLFRPPRPRRTTKPKTARPSGDAA